MKKIVIAASLVITASSAWADPHIDFESTMLVAKLYTCQLQVKNRGGVGATSCAEAKDAALAKFKDNFGKASTNPKVKAMFAQWMTAMDAVGTRMADTEEAKFNTLANELKLE